MTNSKASKFDKLYKRLSLFNENRYLYSIRTSFVSTMPVMMLGAYAVVLNQMPIPFYQRMMEGIFGDQWRMLGALIFNGTTQMVAIFISYLLCYNLAEWYHSHEKRQAHSGICAMVGFACYVIVSIPATGAESLSFAMAGATGIFVSIVISLAASELFIRLSSREKVIRFLSDDPNAVVPQAFSSVMPAIFIIASFALFRVSLVCGGITSGLPELTNDFLRKSFENIGDNFATGVLYNAFTHIMWLVGIHGNNVLDGVAQSVFVPALQANIDAAAAGLEPTKLLTKTFFDAFVYMGGSGVTLALLIALALFGKNQGSKSLVRYAWPNALFNINEPLVFGIPIVFNPVYAIPFVLTPLVMLGTTAFSMYVGLVPYTIHDISWATPIFYSGYLSTGSFAGVLLQAVNLFIAVMIYAPFVKLNGNIVKETSSRAYKELTRVVMDEYSSSSQKLISRVDEVGAAARRLCNHMADALDNRKMFLMYQPIVDAKNKHVHSVEALLRWNESSVGMVNPMVIVALSEELLMVNRLGLWVLEESIAQRKAWIDEGLDDFTVSVNVSASQLNFPAFGGQVLELLDKYRVPRHLLQIEITETVALVGNENTNNNLKLLHSSGISIAMDDFGVGHSSLLYLRTQPVSTLKIDGSLSRDILNSPNNALIISTISDLCTMLKVKAVVEVVETPEQLNILQGMGLHLIQGYLFSKPLPGDEIPKFVSSLTDHYAFSENPSEEDALKS